jgi:L-alanine-DL-glutamate epimerase-like enolase superfamily enzyme
MTTTTASARSRVVEAVDAVRASVFSIPTDAPEADGTATWDATTTVVVEVDAGGRTGTGWTYATGACKTVVDDVLAAAAAGSDPMNPSATWQQAVRRCRNLGRPGVVGCALSALDIALWDLKARLLDLPLCRLLGQIHDRVPVYGSGGFTSYDDEQLVAQLRWWVEELAIPRVKIKIGESWGSNVGRDLARVALTRDVVGPGTEVYVDANGGYAAGQAVRVARELEQFGVLWFEEPVSSDDLTGLAVARRQITPDVAAGEYGYDLTYFERMCAARAVDCLQVDITRCGGITEWMRAAAVAAAHHLDVSAHCAPNLHAHVAAATPNLRHVEYFHDHVRIEDLLFEGALAPRDGALCPDTGSAGHGLRLRRDQAQQYRTA